MNSETIDLQKAVYIPDDFHERLILEHYKDLQALQTFIELGNAEDAFNLILHILSSANWSASPESTNVRPLNYQKQLVSLNTICTLSVSRFHLNPLYLYTVAIHYNNMLDKITSQAQCLSLMHNMLEDYCSLSIFSNKGAYSDTIQQAIWHITADPTHTLDLPSLAQSLGMSPASLSRKFRQETGVTLSQYHTSFRIRSAQRYLQEGRFSITQVAYHMGFNDASYFSKVFTKETGCSPTEYIRQFREL